MWHSVEAHELDNVQLDRAEQRAGPAGDCDENIAPSGPACPPALSNSAVRWQESRRQKISLFEVSIV